MKARTILVIIVMAALLWPIVPSYAAVALPHAVPGELLIRVTPALQFSAHGLASGQYAVQLNAQLANWRVSAAEPIFPDGSAYRLKLPESASLPAAIAALRGLPGVRSVEPNHIHQSMLTPNDSVWRQQWALRNIQAPEAWDLTTGGEVVIAILDTGVSGSHEDLKRKLVPGFNAISGGDNTGDDEGHGTYVAGVAAAESNNDKGIAGVCWGCRIMPIKVLDNAGRGNDATVAAGIRWAVDNGARILSMSLGSPEDGAVLRDAVVYAHQRNALLIAASGNGQAEGNQPNYPGAYPEVLAVAATDGADNVTGFSTTGDFVDVTAPGVGVWSTGLEDGRDSYVAANGTSAACPHVAGIAGLILSVRPGLTNDQLADVLRSTADDRGAPGKDPTHGYGRVNAFRAVQRAADPGFDPNQVVIPPENSAFQPVAPPNDGTLYFGETGHTLRGAFRAFWERNGGLKVFGFPISEEFSENGLTVQYFERHRLEFHPENAPPYNVLLGRMGADRLALDGRDWQQFPKSGNQPGCRFFIETGQSICGILLNAWRASGLEIDGVAGVSEAESLALFGLPLSGVMTEEIDGQTRQVQWFERARFEIHPENTAPFDVLFGLLGTDLAQKKGWLR